MDFAVSDSENIGHTKLSRKDRRNSRRSSILKIPGTPLEDIDQNSGEVTCIKEKKKRKSSSRRVSFAEKLQIKEFPPDTYWKNEQCHQGYGNISKCNQDQLQLSGDQNRNEYQSVAKEIQGLPLLDPGNKTLAENNQEKTILDETGMDLTVVFDNTIVVNEETCKFAPSKKICDILKCQPNFDLSSHMRNLATEKGMGDNYEGRIACVTSTEDTLNYPQGRTILNETNMDLTAVFDNTIVVNDEDCKFRPSEKIRDIISGQPNVNLTSPSRKPEIVNTTSLDAKATDEATSACHSLFQDIINDAQDYSGKKRKICELDQNSEYEISNVGETQKAKRFKSDFISRLQTKMGPIVSPCLTDSADLESEDKENVQTKFKSNLITRLSTKNKPSVNEDTTNVQNENLALEETLGANGRTTALKKRSLETELNALPNMSMPMHTSVVLLEGAERKSELTKFANRQSTEFETDPICQLQDSSKNVSSTEVAMQKPGHQTLKENILEKSIEISPLEGNELHSQFNASQFLDKKRTSPESGSDGSEILNEPKNLSHQRQPLSTLHLIAEFDNQTIPLKDHINTKQVESTHNAMVDPYNGAVECEGNEFHGVFRAERKSHSGIGSVAHSGEHGRKVLKLKSTPGDREQCRADGNINQRSCPITPLPKESILVHNILSSTSKENRKSNPVHSTEETTTVSRSLYYPEVKDPVCAMPKKKGFDISGILVANTQEGNDVSSGLNEVGSHGHGDSGKDLVKKATPDVIISEVKAIIPLNNDKKYFRSIDFVSHCQRDILNRSENISLPIVRPVAQRRLGSLPGKDQTFNRKASGNVLGIRKDVFYETAVQADSTIIVTIDQNIEPVTAARTTERQIREEKSTAILDNINEVTDATSESSVIVEEKFSINDGPRTSVCQELMEPADQRETLPLVAGACSDMVTVRDHEGVGLTDDSKGSMLVDKLALQGCMVTSISDIVDGNMEQCIERSITSAIDRVIPMKSNCSSDCVGELNQLSNESLYGRHVPQTTREISNVLIPSVCNLSQEAAAADNSLQPVSVEMEDLGKIRDEKHNEEKRRETFVINKPYDGIADDRTYVISSERPSKEDRRKTFTLVPEVESVRESQSAIHLQSCNEDSILERAGLAIASDSASTHRRQTFAMEHVDSNDINNVQNTKSISFHGSQYSTNDASFTKVETVERMHCSTSCNDVDNDLHVTIQKPWKETTLLTDQLKSIGETLVCDVVNNELRSPYDTRQQSHSDEDGLLLSENIEREILAKGSLCDKEIESCDLKVENGTSKQKHRSSSKRVDGLNQQQVASWESLCQETSLQGMSPLFDVDSNKGRLDLSGTMSCKTRLFQSKEDDILHQTKEVLESCSQCVHELFQQVSSQDPVYCPANCGDKLNEAISTLEEYLVETPSNIEDVNEVIILGKQLLVAFKELYGKYRSNEQTVDDATASKKELEALDVDVQNSVERKDFLCASAQELEDYAKMIASNETIIRRKESDIERQREEIRSIESLNEENGLKMKASEDVLMQMKEDIDKQINIINDEEFEEEGEMEKLHEHLEILESMLPWQLHEFSDTGALFSFLNGVLELRIVFGNNGAVQDGALTCLDFRLGDCIAYSASRVNPKRTERLFHWLSPYLMQALNPEKLKTEYGQMDLLAKLIHEISIKVSSFEDLLRDFEMILSQFYGARLEQESVVFVMQSTHLRSIFDMKLSVHLVDGHLHVKYDIVHRDCIDMSQKISKRLPELAQQHHLCFNKEPRQLCNTLLKTLIRNEI